MVVAINGAIDVSGTLESRLRFIQVVAHRSHVPQFVESFSHGWVRWTIDTFLDGKCLVQRRDGLVIFILVREGLGQSGQAAGRLGVVIAVVGLSDLERLPV